MKKRDILAIIILILIVGLSVRLGLQALVFILRSITAGSINLNALWSYYVWVINPYILQTILLIWIVFNIIRLKKTNYRKRR